MYVYTQPQPFVLFIIAMTALCLSTLAILIFSDYRKEQKAVKSLAVSTSTVGTNISNHTHHENSFLHNHLHLNSLKELKEEFKEMTDFSKTGSLETTELSE